jgi:hypothetical protein
MGNHGRQRSICRRRPIFLPPSTTWSALIPVSFQGPGARRPVSRVLSALACGTAIPLGRALRRASRDQPGQRSGKCSCALRRGRPYSVLLPVGFTLPPLSPGARCALAAPFRPCPRAAARRLRGRYDFCGTFPEVALAGGYPAPYSRGARTFLYRLRGSGRPAVWQRQTWARQPRGVKRTTPERDPAPPPREHACRHPPRR